MIIFFQEILKINSKHLSLYHFIIGYQSQYLIIMNFILLTLLTHCLIHFLFQIQPFFQFFFPNYDLFIYVLLLTIFSIIFFNFNCIFHRFLPLPIWNWQQNHCDSFLPQFYNQNEFNQIFIHFLMMIMDRQKTIWNINYKLFFECILPIIIN